MRHFCYCALNHCRSTVIPPTEQVRPWPLTGCVWEGGGLQRLGSFKLQVLALHRLNVTPFAQQLSSTGAQTQPPLTAPCLPLRTTDLSYRFRRASRQLGVTVTGSWQPGGGLRGLGPVSQSDHHSGSCVTPLPLRQESLCLFCGQ
eukprot:1440744-Rhodomonas_salina.8